MARTRNAGRPLRSARPSQSQPQRQSLARSSKPKNLYLDESDDETDSNDVEDTEVSSQSDDEASDDEPDIGVDRTINDLEIHATRPRKLQAVKKKTPRRTTATASRARRHAASQNRAASRGTKRPGSNQSSGTPKKKSRTTGMAKQPSPSLDPSLIPNWLSPAIPYFAWVDIFYYAAIAGGNLDNTWLLHSASTCKAFFEPALTVLYRNPSPYSSIKAKKLAMLLEQPSSETLLDYRAKIESIYIDIDKFPTGRLFQVLSSLGRLKELIIFTPLDQPPYRDLDRTIRWKYPEHLFKALEGPADDAALSSPAISLKSWEWASRFLGGFVADVNAMSTIHQLPSFANLTKLSFTNFQFPSLRKPLPKDEESAMQLYEEDGQVIDAIAASIAHLKSLRHLTFESSTVMNDRMLPQLPTTLQHLELINCWEVRSEDLSPFLATHGHHLLSLTLLHNQSLDLAFLTNLATACPKLRNLRMNLSYYRHHDSLADDDPMYEQALLPDQIPCWPSTLRLIEIEHVRQWTPEAAETFLQSLVDAAPNLPDLRHLAIKTRLDIPWQTRTELRQTWRDKLERVFLRSPDPPVITNPLRAGKDVEPVTEGDNSRERRLSTPTRRSARSVAQTDSDRQSPRLRNGGRPRYRDPDTDEDEIDSPSEDEAFSQEEADFAAETKKTEQKTLPVQGMCETVSIMFDNQKVRELQYGMEDFNDDDEYSSGQEWNGDEDDDDDAVFVW